VAEHYRRNGLPSIQCAAKSRRTGEQCKRWARAGTVVCRHHGGAAGQVVRRADVRLAIGELAVLDPRPVKQVLADACDLADIVLQDARQGLVHGQSTPRDVDRALETARYAATMAKLCLDAGVVGPPEPPPPKTLEALVDRCTAALGSVLDGLTDELPRARGIQLRAWAVDAIGEYLAALERGEEPPGPPPKPVAFGLSPAPLNRWTSRPADDDAVLDAELVEDADVDEELPGDSDFESRAGGVAFVGGSAVRRAERRRLAAQVRELRSLVHTDVGEFEADPRPGAVLLRDDGGVPVVVCRRVEPPPRAQGWRSFGERSLSPWQELPPDHPRANEDLSKSVHSLERDAAEAHVLLKRP
jgi:hypothetical protein